MVERIEFHIVTAAVVLMAWPAIKAHIWQPFKNWLDRRREYRRHLDSL